MRMRSLRWLEGFACRLPRQAASLEQANRVLDRLDHRARAHQGEGVAHFPGVPAIALEGGRGWLSRDGVQRGLRALADAGSPRDLRHRD